MDPTVFWAAVGAISAALAAMAALAVLVLRPLRQIKRQGDEQARQQAEFREDWYGEKARPGVDARPGVMERLKGIEKEMHPNGGATMRDAINATRAETGQLREAFEAHQRNHQGPPQSPSVRVEVQPTPGAGQPL